MTPTLWRDLAGVLVFAAALGMSVVLGTFTAWPPVVWVGLFTLAAVSRVAVELATRGEGAPSARPDAARDARIMGNALRWAADWIRRTYPIPRADSVTGEVSHAIADALDKQAATWGADVRYAGTDGNTQVQGEPDLPLFDQARQVATDPNRCAVCGWDLSPSGASVVARSHGCNPGDCRQRPPPETFYDRERAIREYAPHAPPTPEWGRS